MPLDTSEFPEEVQVAFFICDLLSDRWDGMSGTYLGKDWNYFEFLCRVYEIQDIKTCLYFAKLYERCLVEYRMEEQDKRRKAEERRAKAGGGAKYTHNVQG